MLPPLDPIQLISALVTELPLFADMIFAAVSPLIPVPPKVIIVETASCVVPV